jgi:hypothetical protein
MATGCCSSSFRLATRSSILLPRHTLLQSFASLRPFSVSSPTYKPPQGKPAQKLSKAAIAHKVKQLRQEVEDRKVAQERAEKLRIERQEQLMRPEKDEEAVDSVTRASVIPMKSYRSQNGRGEAMTPEDIVHEEKMRDFNRAATEIMARGEEVELYSGPKSLGVLTFACTLTFVACSVTMLGEVWTFLPFLDTWLIGSATAFTMLLWGYALWQSVSKRAGMIRRITLVPKAYGNTRILEVRVQGTGWIPFTSRTVQTPLWEVKVNRPVQSMQLPPKHNDMDHREAYNMFQWPIAIWNMLKDTWRNLRYVIIPWPKISPLVRVFTEEGNEALLSSWWLDARGKFWRNAEGKLYIFS